VSVSVQAYKAVVKRQLFDWSFWPPLRAIASAGLYGRYWLKGGGGREASFPLLLQAHRYAAGRWGTSHYCKLIKRYLHSWLAVSAPMLRGALSQGKMRSFRSRTLVLKPPRFEGDSVAEPGVLFTKTFGELAMLVDLPRLLAHYRLVIEPGWSGYADPVLLYYCRFETHPIIVCAPERTDYEFLQQLGSNLIPVLFGASDWVNPEVFYPIGGMEKRYDAVMVAGWAVYKRHHALFRALQRLRHTDIRVALLGFEWEGSRSEIELLIDYYGTRNHLDIYQSLPPPEVNRILNQSKVNLILTLREGANKSIFEGFFADVPGIVLRNNIGINKDYINESTGRLIEERELPEVLLWFREHYRDFHPREWAIRHISPQATTAKLNAVLRDIAQQRGEPWTRDIVAKTNCPHPMYYPDGSVAEGFPTIDDILRQYGRCKDD